MGIRIVGRRERLSLLRNEAMKQVLVEEEADRFLKLKGTSDEGARRDFIDKIMNIRQSVEGADSAQALAERLEIELREAREVPGNFLGPLEPSVVLDLL